MQYTDIRFPHLGIVFSHVGRYIQIGNFQIMYYGVIIAIGFILGLFMAQNEANRTGQDKELFLDFFLYMMIPAIIGARIYYVVFSWDYYKDHLGEIINLRQGGLGVVGGVAISALILYLFCKKRNYKMTKMMDCISMGLLVGQIIGRWGNFFNREAFGCYTDGPFAMQIPLKYFEQHNRLGELASAGLLDHLKQVNVDGQMIDYIQVHPTFLYEGIGNLLILCFILIYRKHKKFDGELICIYFMGYGFCRFLIEGLRTDQLIIGHTGIAATQVVCVAIFILGAVWTMLARRGSLAQRK
ncbi:MAG: prolipoprotein diacylglyceryl transferase [Eubacteriales bacterium]|nr:prolipoprotein diacylglyceryl transferase [Eubacteriales bacterium]